MERVIESISTLPECLSPYILSFCFKYKPGECAHCSSTFQAASAPFKVWGESFSTLPECLSPYKWSRSEERRVGKEWRSRWAAYHLKKKGKTTQQDMTRSRDVMSLKLCDQSRSVSEVRLPI